MFGSQIHALPDTNIHQKTKKKERKYGIYIQYPLSQSPYSNYSAINRNLKIDGQMQQGMSWSMSGQ